MDRDGKAPRHGDLSCSFCGKGQQDVRKLIAGPDVYICDECTALCADIVAGDEGGAPPPAGDALAAAARLVRACEADPRIPRIVVDMVAGLAASLRKHLEPRDG